MILKTLSAAVIGLMIAMPSAFAQETAEGSSTFPTPAKPQGTDAMRTHLGLNVGYTDTEGPADTMLGYGIDYGIQPYIPFGLGAELASTTNEGDLTRTTLLGRATYNFGGNIPVINRSYVGAALGPVWDTESSNNGLRFGIAPVLGFDIPLGKELTNEAVTLGLNAKYLLVNESAVDMFALNGSVKYWF